MTGNFLSHSHHPRVGSLPDGGGLWEWTGGEHDHDNDNRNKDDDNATLTENGMTALENFMKLAAENKSNTDETCEKVETQQSWEEQEKNDENRNIDDKSFQQRLCMDQIENASFGESQKTSDGDEIKSDNLDFLKTTTNTTMRTPSQDINKRVIKQEGNIGDYDCADTSVRDETTAHIENEENRDNIPDYKFRGDGGPAKMSPGTGSWCCRRGGTEQPTPEHLRDGCCQGLQTKDEMLADSPQRTELKNEGPHSPRTSSAASTTTKLQDHLDKLKNVRTEVPDCNCFPADKCELQLRILHYTNIERTH